MKSIFTPQVFSNRYRVLRIGAIATLMFVFQVTTNPIDAHAGAIQDTYISITSGIAFDLGYRACSYPCAAAAVGVMAAVNTYAPEVAKRAATKGKTDMKKMFTDWGSTYVRP